MPGMAWTPSTISSLLRSSLVMSVVYCLSPAWGSGEAAVKAIYPLRIMRALIAGRPSLEIGCGGSFGPIPREYRDVTG